MRCVSCNSRNVGRAICGPRSPGLRLATTDCRPHLAVETAPTKVTCLFSPSLTGSELEMPVMNVVRSRISN